MRARLAFFVCAAVLSTPVPLLSQTQAAGGSILWLVPPAGRLEPDAELTGTLSSSDHFSPNDIYIDVWELQGRAGGSVTIDLKSSDFDAVLFVVGPGLAETLWDDDSGGSCNARISVRFLEDGTYRVAATTTAPRTTGVYTLVASADPAPASGAPCGGPDPAMLASLPVTGRVTPGEPASGTLDATDAVLDDGAHVEVWEVAGEQGRTATIRLESAAFDSFLYVMGPGLDAMLGDDDSGGDLDSEITFAFPATDTYRIVVTSVEPGGTGAYRLTVTQ